MALLILAASGFAINYVLRVLGYIIGGYNGRVAVDYLVSVLLLCLTGWRIF